MINIGHYKEEIDIACDGTKKTILVKKSPQEITLYNLRHNIPCRDNSYGFKFRNNKWQASIEQYEALLADMPQFYVGGPLGGPLCWNGYEVVCSTTEAEVEKEKTTSG